VFAISALLFCDQDEKQCYNWRKAASTVTVVCGILLYSYGKSLPPPSSPSKSKRRMSGLVPTVVSDDFIALKVQNFSNRIHSKMGFDREKETSKD
jgi:hypothetical protein